MLNKFRIILSFAARLEFLQLNCLSYRQYSDLTPGSAGIPRLKSKGKGGMRRSLACLIGMWSKWFRVSALDHCHPATQLGEEKALIRPSEQVHPPEARVQPPSWHLSRLQAPRTNHPSLFMCWAVPGFSAGIDWRGLPIYKGEALGTRLRCERKERLNLVPSLSALDLPLTEESGDRVSK